MMDLNGDGLADKVFKKGGSVYYRANLGINKNTGRADFSSPYKLNISEINSEQTTNFNGGAEAYYYGNGYVNEGKTTVTSNTYFSDVNADGLPDLVRDRHVFFNHLENDQPTFTEDSSGTPVPIASGELNTEGLIEDFRKYYQDMLDKNPLMDAVRSWTVPYDGVVTIEAPIQLQVQESRQTGDGIRAAIQQNGSELWSIEIVEMISVDIQ